jgi:hypothetical protein
LDVTSVKEHYGDYEENRPNSFAYMRRLFADVHCACPGKAGEGARGTGSGRYTTEYRTDPDARFIYPTYG